MSTKRLKRKKACEGKQRHATREEALGHSSRLKHLAEEKNIRVYRCPFCKGWHVGHYRRPSALA